MWEENKNTLPYGHLAKLEAPNIGAAACHPWLQEETFNGVMTETLIVKT